MSLLLKHKKTNRSTVVSCETIGNRPTMEDRIFLCKSGGVEIYGVFDGHTGDRCSSFLSKNLPRRLLEIDNLCEDSIKEVFDAANESFKKTHQMGGSTCCLVIIENNKCYICNTGDSRAMVVRNFEIIYKTVDHIPINEEERLKECGALVSYGRLNGQLAVSRAFGDFYYRGITCEPDIKVIDLEDGDIIHICSDGISTGVGSPDEFKTFPHRRVLDTLVEFWHKGMEYANAKLTKVASKLIGDNASSILIKREKHQNSTELVKSYIPTCPWKDSGFEAFASYCGLSLVDAKTRWFKLMESNSDREIENFAADGFDEEDEDMIKDYDLFKVCLGYERGLARMRKPDDEPVVLVRSGRDSPVLEYSEGE